MKPFFTLPQVAVAVALWFCITILTTAAFGGPVLRSRIAMAAAWLQLRAALAWIDAGDLAAREARKRAAAARRARKLYHEGMRGERFNVQR